MIAAGNADAYAQVGKSVYLIFMRLVNRIGSTIPQTLPWVQKLIIRYLCITGIHCWDLVAGALIVKEAGGTLVDPRTGSDFDYMSRGVLAASSPQLAKQVLDLNLKHHKVQRDHSTCGGLWWNIRSLDNVIILSYQKYLKFEDTTIYK